MLKQPKHHTGMHTHLTRDARIALAALLASGLSQRKAAKHLGVCHSTVSRELRRNSRSRGYHATHADVLARGRRRRSKQKYRLLENNQRMASLVEALLDPLVSPECIGHLLDIAHGTIYTWLYRTRPDLIEHLPQRTRRRRRYGSKRAKKQGWTRLVRSIEERPDALESWEGDTVKGSTRARLLTHVERRSLYTFADLIPDGTAEAVHAATLQRSALHHSTLTYDRGSEFALWAHTERRTYSKVFFARPHAPWQRGKNENTNGRLRRPFPKRFDFATISKQDLASITDLMNHTPRKSLSWRTPCRVWGKCCVSD